MSKIFQTLSALLISAFAILYFASPYWAVSSLRTAVESGDADKIESAVDFPAVRESLKAQLAARFTASINDDPQMRENPFAGLGMMIVPAMMDRILDNLVTPEGFAQLMKGGGPQDTGSQSKWPDFEVSSNYIDLNRFRSILRRSDRPGSLILTFTRVGLFGWKLTKIVPPSPQPKLSSDDASNLNSVQRSAGAESFGEQDDCSQYRSGSGGPIYDSQGTRVDAGLARCDGFPDKIVQQNRTTETATPNHRVVPNIPMPSELGQEYSDLDSQVMEHKSKN